jgi:ferredoxin-thioredoxin reductase catalytic subunit
MNFSPEEQAIKDRLDEYVKRKPFVYYPDEEVVERIIKGLAKREEKSGQAYCPCRLVTGKPELDKKIVCPCEYHEDEIAKQGFCHCRLFASADFKPEKRD